MQFVINGKHVDLNRALPYAKPFNQMVTGELKLLDRLGFSMVGRDMGRDGFTYDDIFGLVAYFVMKANPAVRVADIDKLSIQEFGKITAVISEHFMSVMFPAGSEPRDAAVQDEDKDGTPFPDGSDTKTTPSAEPSAGHPETVTR